MAMAAPMTDDEIIDAIRSHPDPFVSLPEIKDEVEPSKETLRRRCHDLVASGKLRSKKFGARAVAWWVPGDEPAAVETAD